VRTFYCAHIDSLKSATGWKTDDYYARPGSLLKIVRSMLGSSRETLDARKGIYNPLDAGQCTRSLIQLNLLSTIVAPVHDCDKLDGCLTTLLMWTMVTNFCHVAT
jgi:hypothetical protein